MIRGFFNEYRWLSNFIGGVEQEYQAAKTNDPIFAEKIRKASSPALAKRMGKACPIRPDWEEIKEQTMLSCLRKKFTPGSHFAKLLLETGEQELIEENYWGDTYWGVCKGVGKNRLGVLLMKVRQELKDKEIQ